MPSKLRTPVLVALTMTAVSCVAAEADDLALLRGTPLESLSASASDYGRFMAFVGRAAGGPLGRRLEWSAGAERGTLSATAGFRREGQRCRELRGEAIAAGQPGLFRITYCRAGTGSWQLAPNRPERKSVPPTPSRASAR